MKTETMLLIAGGAAVAYFVFIKKPAAATTAAPAISTGITLGSPVSLRQAYGQYAAGTTFTVINWTDAPNLQQNAANLPVMDASGNAASIPVSMLQLAVQQSSPSTGAAANGYSAGALYAPGAFGPVRRMYG